MSGPPEQARQGRAEPGPARRGRPGWKGPAALLLLLLLAPACGSPVWVAHEGLKELHAEIDRSRAEGMKEKALYHLDVAATLLEAAEEQYEEADFPAAIAYIDLAREHLYRARKIQALEGQVPPEAATTGGRP